MNRLSKAPTFMKIGVVAGFALAASGIDAYAAEVRFLCADALEASLRELIPEFETVTGHSVRMIFANAGTNTARVRQQDLADLAIVLPQQWETLRREGRIDPAVRVVICKVGLGVFVRK